MAWSALFHKRPATERIYILFVVKLNKLLNEQSGDGEMRRYGAHVTLS